MKQYSKSRSDVLMFPLKGHTVTDSSGKLVVNQSASSIMPVKIGGMVCRVYEGKLCVIPESLTHRSNIVLEFEPVLKNGTELIFCDRLDNSKRKMVNIDGEVSTLEIGYDRNEGLFISYDHDTEKHQYIKSSPSLESEKVMLQNSAEEKQSNAPIAEDFCEANTERIGERITMIKNTVSVYSASSGGKEDERLNKVCVLITEAESILAIYIADRQKKSENDMVID